jgi:uncharacterized membrane protein YdjX (TVP38/TMEM64 family)
MSSLEQRKGKFRLSGRLLGLLVMIAVVMILMFLYGGKSYFRLEGLTSVFKNKGKWAPVLLILLGTIRPLTFVPASALAIPAGIVFGTGAGGIYAIIGQTFSAGLAFWVARYFGRVYVEKLLSKKLKEKTELISKFQKEKGFKTVFFLRLVPVVPFDLISYGAGVSELRFFPYLLATILGTIPVTLVYTYLGSSLKTWRTGRFFYPLAVLTIIAVGSSIYYYLFKIKKNKQGVK